MKIKEIIDDKDGRKWEIYKKSDNEYFYKYYEFHKASGWRFLWQEGDHLKGYFTKDLIQFEFEIMVG